MEMLGWEARVMNYIEQHWSDGETFTRDDIYRQETRFARYYPDNRHIRTKLAQVLRTLAANGEIEAIDRATFRRTTGVKDAP